MPTPTGSKLDCSRARLCAQQFFWGSFHCCPPIDAIINIIAATQIYRYAQFASQMLILEVTHVLGSLFPVSPPS